MGGSGAQLSNIKNTFDANFQNTINARQYSGITISNITQNASTDVEDTAVVKLQDVSNVLIDNITHTNSSFLSDANYNKAVMMGDNFMSGPDTSVNNVTIQNSDMLGGLEQHGSVSNILVNNSESNLCYHSDGDVFRYLLASNKTGFTENITFNNVTCITYREAGFNVFDFGAGTKNILFKDVVFTSDYARNLSPVRALRHLGAMGADNLTLDNVTMIGAANNIMLFKTNATLIDVDAGDKNEAPTDYHDVLGKIYRIMYVAPEYVKFQWGGTDFTDRIETLDGTAMQLESDSMFFQNTVMFPFMTGAYNLSAKMRFDIGRSVGERNITYLTLFEKGPRFMQFLNSMNVSNLSDMCTCDPSNMYYAECLTGAEKCHIIDNLYIAHGAGQPATLNPDVLNSTFNLIDSSQEDVPFLMVHTAAITLIESKVNATNLKSINNDFDLSLYSNSVLNCTNCEFGPMIFMDNTSEIIAHNITFTYIEDGLVYLSLNYPGDINISGKAFVSVVDYRPIAAGTDENDIVLDLNVTYAKQFSMKKYNVYLNSTYLPQLNKSSQMIFEQVQYQYPVLLKNGVECNQSECPSTWDPIGKVFTADVYAFSNYTLVGRASLYVYDEADPEGGSIVKYTNESVTFWANYTNVSSGENLPGSNCTVMFHGNDTANDMTWNGNNYEFTKTDGFSPNGTYSWNVSCSKEDFDNLTTTDNITLLTALGSGIAAGVTKPNGGTILYIIPLIGTGTRALGLMQDFGGDGIGDQYNASGICCLDVSGQCSGSPSDLMLFYSYDLDTAIFGTADYPATGTCDGAAVNYYFDSSTGNLELLWEKDSSLIDFDADVGDMFVTQTFNHAATITLDGNLNENYASESITGTNSTAYKMQVGPGLKGFIGKKTNTALSGLSGLDVNVNSDTKSEGRVYSAPKLIKFKLGGQDFITFTHDFSQNAINYSQIIIQNLSNGLIIKGMQLASGETKTVNLPAGNFSRLCVKDSEISSISQISLTCTGENESNLNLCINNPVETYYNGVSCYYDSGTDTYVIGNLSHTGFAFGGNSNLAIYDSVEGSYKEPTLPVDFYANYTNGTGDYLAGADCTITFIDGSAPMTDNGANYNYTRSFASEGIYQWNVSCNLTGYDTLNTTDDVNISSGGGGGSTLSYLVVFDESNGTSKNANVSITFYANYTNSTGDAISTGTCIAYFDDSTSISLSTYSGGLYSGAKSAGFAAEGVHQWNATCTDLTYDAKTAFDDVTISGTSSPSAVPEFSDFAVMLLLAITLSGFFVMRYKKFVYK